MRICALLWAMLALLVVSCGGGGGGGQQGHYSAQQAAVANDLLSQALEAYKLGHYRIYGVDQDYNSATTTKIDYKTILNQDESGLKDGLSIYEVDIESKNYPDQKVVNPDFLLFRCITGSSDDFEKRMDEGSPNKLMENRLLFVKNSGLYGAVNGVIKFDEIVFREDFPGISYTIEFENHPQNMGKPFYRNVFPDPYDESPLPSVDVSIDLSALNLQQQGTPSKKPDQVEDNKSNGKGNNSSSPSVERKEVKKVSPETATTNHVSAAVPAAPEVANIVEVGAASPSEEARSMMRPVSVQKTVAELNQMLINDLNDQQVLTFAYSVEANDVTNKVSIKPIDAKSLLKNNKLAFDVDEVEGVEGIAPSPVLYIGQVVQQGNTFKNTMVIAIYKKDSNGQDSGFSKVTKIKNFQSKNKGEDLVFALESNEVQAAVYRPEYIFDITLAYMPETDQEDKK